MILPTIHRGNALPIAYQKNRPQCLTIFLNTVLKDHIINLAYTILSLFYDSLEIKKAFMSHYSFVLFFQISIDDGFLN